MNDRQYNELLGAILDLRGATELGFSDVSCRFEDVYHRLDGLQQGLDDVHHGLDHVNGRIDAVQLRLGEMEERWDRRFHALEIRVEDGFGSLSASLGAIHTRLSSVEQR
jgi:hypothetical protein